METWGFPGGSVVKNPLAIQGTQETGVWSLGWDDPLEKGIATHSSILAGRIPWTEEPSGLQSLGLQRWTQLKWLSTLKDTWLVSSFWLSWIKHLWTFVCKFCVNVRFHISGINVQLIKLFRGNWSSKIFMLSYKRKVKVKVAQSCPILCDSIDYTVHGIL